MNALLLRSVRETHGHLRTLNFELADDHLPALSKHDAISVFQELAPLSAEIELFKTLFSQSLRDKTLAQQ
jgi:hypothetical protein